MNIIMATTRQNIAKQVKEAREKQKLTQAEVAKSAEITTTYYAMIERAEANANSDILGRIGKVLKISIKI
jgi:transcriptional regulator with XRE-family HTH domain